MRFDPHFAPAELRLCTLQLGAERGVWVMPPLLVAAYWDPGASSKSFLERWGDNQSPSIDDTLFTFLGSARAIPDPRAGDHLVAEPPLAFRQPRWWPFLGAPVLAIWPSALARPRCPNSRRGHAGRLSVPFNWVNSFGTLQEFYFRHCEADTAVHGPRSRRWTIVLQITIP